MAKTTEKDPLRQLDTKLVRYGTSVAMPFPGWLSERLSLQPGDALEIEVSPDNKSFMVKMQ